MSLVSEIVIKLPNTPEMRESLREVAEHCHWEKGKHSRGYARMEAYEQLMAEITKAIQPEQLEKEQDEWTSNR